MTKEHFGLVATMGCKWKDSSKHITKIMQMKIILNKCTQIKYGVVIYWDLHKLVRGDFILITVSNGPKVVSYRNIE